MLWLFHILFSFKIECVKNGYPKGLKSNCIRAYSCAVLARRNMCGKKYSKSMSRGCNNQITKWSQNQLVRNFCKLSCKKCIRKYYPYNFINTIPNYSWLWKSIDFWINYILGSRQGAETARNGGYTETVPSGLEMRSPQKDKGTYIVLIVNKKVCLQYLSSYF